MSLWAWVFFLGAAYAGEINGLDAARPPDFSLIPAYYGKATGENHPLVEHVQKSIEQASLEKGKLSPKVLKIDGMTSAKGRYLLNHLCSLPNAVYLEIGPWKGSSFIAALYQKSYLCGKRVGALGNL